MATQAVTLCWLDGFNQYRSKTIKRKVRPIPDSPDFHSTRGWPLHYTHMVMYYGRYVPAHDYNSPEQGAGPNWWAFADY